MTALTLPVGVKAVRSVLPRVRPRAAVLAMYLAPVERVRTKTGWLTRPQGLDVVRRCPGFQRVWTNFPRGGKVPYTHVTVLADRMDPIAADPRFVLVGQSVHDRWVGWLDAPAVARPVSPLVAERFRALGMDVSGHLVPRQLFRRIADRLCPALHDLSFGEHVLPIDVPVDPLALADGEPHTRWVVTDDFAGTGALGSGWDVVQLDGSSQSAERDSGRVVSAASTFNKAMAVRTEAAFPNDHYAQLLSRCSGGTGDGDVSWILPAVRGNDTGDGYVQGAWGTATVDLRRVENGVEELYISAGGAGSWTNGNDYTVRMDASGTTIQLTIASTVEDSGTDDGSQGTAFSTGKPWMYVSSNDAAQYSADDWESTDATGGAPSIPPGIFNNPRRGGGGLITGLAASALMKIIARRRDVGGL